MSTETREEREARLLQLAREREEQRRLREQRLLEEREVTEKAAPHVNYQQELLVSLGRGVVGAASETADMLAAVDEWATKHVGSWDLNPFDGDGIGLESVGEDYESPLRFAERGAEFVRNSIPEPETVGGDLVEAGTRFVAGFVGAGKFRWLQHLKAGGKIARTGGMAAQGAIADFAVFDGHEERLSDFLIQFDNPALNNAVTQYLAVNGESNEDVGELEGRMRNVLEGAGLGMIAEGFIRGIRALKPARRVRDAHGKLKERKRPEIREADEVDLQATDEDGAEVFDFRDETLDAALQETVEATSRKPGAAFQVVRNGADELQVLPSRDNVRGGMRIYDRGEYIQSNGLSLAPENRGAGLSTEIIREAIDYAHSLGKGFASDSKLTKAAAASYERLQELGYKLRKAEHTIDEDGSLVTRDGGPLYVIDDVPEGTGIRRVNAQKTKLDASVNIDDLRSTVQRLVDEGATEKLIDDLAAGKTPSKLRESNQHYIDWDSFADDPEAFVSFVRAFEDAYGEAIKAAKGGRVPTRETAERGLKLLEEQAGGELAANLFGDVTADGGLSSRIFAGQQLLAESRAYMYELAERAQRGNNRAQAKLLQHANAHAALEAQVTGAASEIGRSLRAMQIIRKQLTDQSFDLDEMLREAGQTGDVEKFAGRLLANKNDPAAVGQLVRDQVKTTGFDKVLEVMYGNILSAPSTHIANTYGNGIMVAIDMAVRAASVVPGTIRRTVTGSGPTGAGELFGAMVGFGVGLRDSLRFSLRAMRRSLGEADKPLRKMTQAERAAFWEEQEHLGTVWKALITGDAQTDAVTKLGEAGSARRALSYSLPADIGDRPLFAQLLPRMRWLVENSVGSVVRIPGRAIVTVDEFFKTVAARTEEYSLVLPDAYNLARLENPRTTAEAVSTALRYADGMLDESSSLALSKSELREVKQRGIDFARHQTFQTKLDGGPGMKALGWLEKAAQTYKPARLFVPFIRTPTNLALKAMELTPFSVLISRRFRAELMAGGRRTEKAIAQYALSVGFAWQLYEKYQAGELRGGGSGNNSERLQGVDRYSYKAGDRWLTYDRLDPLGMVVGFWTDIFEAADEAESEEALAQLQAALMGSAAAFSSNITSKTYMQGISEFFEAVSYAERGYDDAFKNLAGSILGNLMPIVGANFERRRASGQDEFARYIFGWMDEFRSRIPEGGIADALGLDELIGTRDDLGVRMDPLGRPVKNQLGLTTVQRESTESTSVLDQVLAAMDFHISMPGRRIGDVKLTGKQYSKFLYLRGQEVKIAGQTLEEKLTREINSKLFQRRTLEGQQKRINDIVRDYTSRARKQLLREDDELRTKVEDAEAEKRNSLSLTIEAARRRQPAEEDEQAPNILEQLFGTANASEK